MPPHCPKAGVVFKFTQALYIWTFHNSNMEKSTLARWEFIISLPGNLYYHDLFLSAWSDIAIMVLVVLRLLALLLVFVLLVLLQTGLQLRLLLVHR